MEKETLIKKVEDCTSMVDFYNLKEEILAALKNDQVSE